MSQSHERKLAVLLHADIVGSTALVQKDESLAHARMQAAFRSFADAIAEHGGSTQEIRGDALVAEFARASDAVTAAISFQRHNSRINQSIADDLKPLLRIGIAMGEVIVADNTVTGEGIVLAQRLEQLAPPGGICIQGAARETVPKRLPFAFKSLGEQMLKGFEQPVRAYLLDTGEQVGEMPVAPAAPTKSPILELPAKPSIAILPFDNMSNDPEQEFFAEGISEDIITELSKFRSFFVIARNSSFSFKGQSLNARQIGSNLGVRYVVEGSVRRAGKRVRITAQLIDAVDDTHLWAERYDRDLEDIFAVQDEVTRAIVTAIEPQLATTEQQRARRKPTDNLDAWECYQRGLWHMFSYDRTDEAQHFFERAIALDPEFCRAYAGLAYTRAIRILLGAAADLETELRQGIDAAERAIGIDGGDPFAHFARGRIAIFSGEHERALAAFRRALELNPNYALAHFGLAHGLWHAGRPAEALPHHDEAIRLTPSDPIMWAFLASKAIALVMDGREQEGVAISREAQGYSDHHLFAYLAEVSGLGLLGRVDEAEIALMRLRGVQADISLEFLQRSLPMAESEAKRRFLRGLELAGLG
ncbi:MAG: tetratricopeptide repeat protein [Gammaproteobacteria bacterium]|nr:tetratricopeptide repeat protein [Gammaproteobacteria bacterium]